MASDTKFLGDILLKCSRGASRLFRNVVAQGWVGKSERVSKTGMMLVRAGDVIVHDARPLHAGIMVGSGDLLGWVTVTVTPEMVGRKVAIFASVEGKAGRDFLKPEQITWRDNVLAAGGIAGEVRSVEDAIKLLHYAN